MSKPLAKQIATVADVLDDLAELAEDAAVEQLPDPLLVRSGLAVSRVRKALAGLVEELQAALAPQKSRLPPKRGRPPGKKPSQMRY